MTAVMGPKPGNRTPPQGPTQGPTKEITDPEILAAMRREQEWTEGRHQRRMKLMRMQGDTNRQETRAQIFWIVAAVLAVIALVLGAMS